MVDYTLFNNEEEQPQVGLLKKTRAKIQSPGGVLSNNVRPGQGSMLPSAIDSYRSKAADLYQQGSELYDKEPDFSQLQNFAKQRSEQGEGAMLNAMAAQYAGEGFAPVQQQYLKKAAAARDSMKLGSGLITAEGQYLKDPEAANSKKAEFLLQQAKAYETLAQTAETKEKEAFARSAQNEIMNQLKLMGIQVQQQGVNARAANGPQRAPAGYQWSTTPDGQAALTFIPGGPADPVTKASGTPSEDERKAAGWYFQADNARGNMENVVKRNSAAAYPTIAERGAGVIPLFGEDIANKLRPEDRQMFVQASGSMAEALLRAATGAGVNESEARQKVAELVPQLGDKPGTVKQKTNSYGVYMSSLQARAGRALPKNAADGADAEADPFGIRGRK